MKLLYALTMLLIPFISLNMFPQCVPGDSISCPDPEKNGQICPDTIAPVYWGVDYSQEITFLAPSRIDTPSLSIDVHHLSLISIDGLPEGIEWVTNAENDEFFPEIYYCILFSGNTLADTGTLPLKIVVDVYAWLFGEPVKVVQIEDSTSLSMRILAEPSSIAERTGRLAASIWPNPFSQDFSMELKGVSGRVDVEVINILGERVYSAYQFAGRNSAQIKIDASFLPDGIYFVRLRNGDRRRSYMVSKRQ